MLTDRFLRIWAIPQIEITSNTYAGEINIFEVDDPTNKKMRYARFFGRKVRTSDTELTYAGLLIYVSKAIFDLAPTEFIDKLADTLNAGNSLTTWRRPQKISEYYSIETNLQAKEIFKRLRTILTTFGLEEELYICFQDEINVE